MTYNYLRFEKKEEVYLIYNEVYKEYVGELRRERMGVWMHWHLFMYQGCGFTNGCLKETSRFITTLYQKERFPPNPLPKKNAN